MLRLLSVIAVAAIIAAAGTSTAATSATCTRGLTTVERDPRSLMALTPDAVARAATVALARAPKGSDPIVVRATLAYTDHDRGPSAKYNCDTRVWRRTVVVYIQLRAFKNSASLSEGVDFVGRFKNGYHVWQFVH